MARSQEEIEASGAWTDTSRLQAEVTGLPPGYRQGFRPRWSDYKCYVSPGVANINGTRVPVDEETLITSQMWLISRVPSQWFYVYLTQEGTFEVDPLAPMRQEGTSDYQLYQPVTGALHIASIFLDASHDIVFVGKTQQTQPLVAASTYDGEDADYYCDAKADQVEMLVAATYLSAAFNGGNIQLTSGTFYLDTDAADLQFTQSGIGLIGAGAGATVLSDSGTTGSNAGAVSVLGTSGTHTDGFLMQDLTLTQTGNTTLRHLFAAGYADRITVRRVKFLNSYGSGFHIGIGTQPCLGFLVSDCEAEGFRHRGFASEGGCTGFFINCRAHDNIDDAGATLPVRGIFVGQADPVVHIMSCAVYDLALGSGTNLDLVGIDTGSQTIISGCIVTGITHAHATSIAAGIRIGNNPGHAIGNRVASVTDVSVDGGVGIRLVIADATATANHVNACGTSFLLVSTGNQVVGNVSISPVVAHIDGVVASSRVLANSWEFDATTGDWTPGKDILDLVVTDSTVLNEDGNSTGDFRWEADTDTHGFFGDASAGQAGFFLASSATITGKVDFAPDTDNYFLLGRVWIGYDGASSDAARLGHMDSRSSTAYALSQSSTGSTSVNAASARTINLRIANTSYSQLNATLWDFNSGGLDHDFRIQGDNDISAFYSDASVDAVGFGIAAPLAKVHVDQTSTTGAKPVLLLDQADVSEEFIRFIGTSANGVLTQSIVEAADVTSFTVNAYGKVYLSDDGNQVTDGPYYVAFGTIT